MNRCRPILGTAIVAALLLAATGNAHADGDPGGRIPALATRSVAGADTAENVHGRTAVNLAAGNSNVQSNMTALAIGLDQGSALSTAGLVQGTGVGDAARTQSSFAIIGPGAFANADGLVSLNQGSGSANAQSNVAAVSLGAGAVVASDSVLAETATGVAPGGHATGQASLRAVTSDTAFAGAHGLVQVNQAAGSGNITANSFALRLQAGANP